MRRLLLCLALATLGAALAPAAAPALDRDARYALVHGCYDLRSVALGKTVAADAGPFRMQATTLGRYLLYGKRGDFLSARSDGSVAPAAAPSEDGDWIVDVKGDAFTLTLPSGKGLATDGAGNLVAGAPGAFTFAKADGCATYPESEVGVTGDPSTSPTPWGEVRGLLDGHMHWMAFEFLGGKAHCGKPWDAYGITYALVDCPDHSVPGSPGNVLEAALGGQPTHDTVGWPTFAYWPNYHSLTHEDTYYKWVERAWRAGLRVFVNLFVDNGALCTVYPLKSHDCNEMDTVRLEMRRLHELEDYVDAQNGGPGKGWLRIVTDPFQARKVIAAGKLAVVQGIEVSRLFDCRVYNDVNQCDIDRIERNLDAVYAAGVRDMELVNKFDNAFVGVAGDDATTGVVVNSGNKLETGKYWDMQTCQGLPPGIHDHDQTTEPTGLTRDALVGGILSQFVPHGEAPIYPAAPHCNQRGLTSLGQYLVGRMMDKGMIVDPDHMSVLARNETLDLLEARRYSGVISSHSWSTPDAYPRIYRLGGVITPYAGDSTGFARDYRMLKKLADPRFYWGIGWGADMNGFGSQGPPRPGNASNPVTYPFTSFDGKQTIDRVRTGQRTWDINADGVAHYGLYPDWVQDLRKIAGDGIVDDLGRGAEAYLEMWERAVGVPATRPFPARTRLTSRGLGRVQLGLGNEALLRAAGQPKERGGRAWSWDVPGRDGRPGGEVVAVLTPDGSAALVGSTAPEHTALATGPGDKAPERGRRVGRNLVVRSAGGPKRFVYGVRKGRITFVAVATGAVARKASTLRAYLKLAGLR